MGPEPISMKPLGVLVLVLVAVAGLFFAITQLGGDDGEVSETIGAISQTETQADPKPSPGSTQLATPKGTERSTVPVVPVTSERVDVTPENSEQFANEITGLVLSPDQRPVAGARVTLTRAGLTGMIFQNEPLDRSKDRFTKTDEKGSYSFLNVEPWDQYSVEAVALNYCRGEMGSVSVNATDVSKQPPIVLTLGASLVGTITDVGGNPVPGATVTLEGLFSQFESGPAPDTLKTTSDADGTYMIANVPPGNRRLQVTADGYANQTKAGLVFRGEEPLTMDVQLEVAEMICGKIISKTGSPVVDATVLGMSFSNSNSQCRDQTKSDENGEFCLESLAGGKYTLSINAPGFRRFNESRVQTGAAGLVIELEDQGMINGRIIVTGGEIPVPYEVQLRQTHEGNPVTNLIGESTKFNNADGTFTIECPQSGTFRVQASAPGFAPSFSDEFRFTQSQNMNGVTVRLTQGGGIVGRLVDGEGNPVPRPRITTHDNTWTNSLFDKALGDQFPTNITSAAATGNMDGKFRLKLLKPETYQLRIRAAGFCELTLRDVLVTEGNETDAGEIKMIKGGEITGTVINLAGQPFVGAVVRLNPAGNNNDSPDTYQTKSGTDGKYVLSNVFPGKYKLSASKDGGQMDFLSALSDELDQVQLLTISDGQSLRFELKISK